MDAVEKLPQLKKTDFLSVLTEEPQTVEQVREQLAAKFEFIPSYADFLADHFVEQGRVQRDEQGNLSVKARATNSAGRTATYYKVNIVDGEPQLMSNTDGTAHTNDKDWSQTVSAAVKKAGKENFRSYRELQDKLNELKADTAVATPTTVGVDGEYVSAQEDQPEV